MAQIPKRGVVPPSTGVYETNSRSGVRNSGSESNPYRNSPVGPKSIDEIGYIPYGNVYERENPFEIISVPTGGAYENPAEVAEELASEHILSLTYPPLIVEDISTVFALLSGTINKISIDNFESGFELLSGTLSTTLNRYDVPSEDFASAFEVLSGNLDVLLETYSVPPEDFESAFELTAATLVPALVVYQNGEPEDFRSTFALTGGTLA